MLISTGGNDLSVLVWDTGLAESQEEQEEVKVPIIEKEAVPQKGEKTRPKTSRVKEEIQPTSKGGLFEEVIEEHGDQALPPVETADLKPKECYVKKPADCFPLTWAVKPWVGAIKAPSSWVKE